MRCSCRRDLESETERQDRCRSPPLDVEKFKKVQIVGGLGMDMEITEELVVLHTHHRQRSEMTMYESIGPLCYPFKLRYPLTPRNAFVGFKQNFVAPTATSMHHYLATGCAGSGAVPNGRIDGFH